MKSEETKCECGASGLHLHPIPIEKLPGESDESFGARAWEWIFEQARKEKLVRYEAKEAAAP